MKKLYVLLFCIVCSSLNLLSQKYTEEPNMLFKPVKCEIGGFIGLSKNNNYGFGTGFYLHPSYFVSDVVNIGFKGESTILLRADFDNLASFLNAFHVTSRFYFSKSAVRMYTELGTGVYILNSSAPKEYFFGIAPKAGLDLGPFTMFVAYNHVVVPETKDKNLKHLSLGAGIFIGGAKRK